MTDEENSLRNLNAQGKQSASKRDTGNANFSSQTRRCCNCKQSKCIKLYCECYAAGVYCNPACNCNDCWNNPNFEDHRKAAIQTTLEKNPSAFQPKISTPNFNELKKAELLNYGKHSKGCACKKSGCMKKYCECFQAGIPCSDLCKCSDCHNTKEYYELNKKKGGIDMMKQEDVPDNNSFFFKFLLASNDSEPGTSKHLIPNKKVGGMSQEFLEKLFRKLHAISEMSVEDYLRKNENPQELNEFFNFKKKHSHNKQLNLSSNTDSMAVEETKNSKGDEKSIKTENEELMCDEKVEEIKPEISKSDMDRPENSGQIKVEEANFIGSDDDQKYSFYDIKKKLILREFISVLRTLE